MRPLRSALLLVSTAAVIGCQTAGSIARTETVPSAAAQSPARAESSRAESRPVATAKEYVAKPAAEPARRRTMVVIAVIVLAAIIAVVLISGGDGLGSAY